MPQYDGSSISTTHILMLTILFSGVGGRGLLEARERKTYEINIMCVHTKQKKNIKSFINLSVFKDYRVTVYLLFPIFLNHGLK